MNKLSRQQIRRLTGGQTQMAAATANNNPTYKPNQDMQGQMPTLDSDND